MLYKVLRSNFSSDGYEGGDGSFAGNRSKMDSLGFHAGQSSSLIALAFSGQLNLV